MSTSPSGGQIPLTTGELRDKKLLGLPASQVQPQLTQDVFKELINKLAWCLGSTYRMPYANRRCAVRLLAVSLARAVVVEHGYPASIGFPTE